MKSLIATGLVLGAGIVGSLAPATSAYALPPIMHAGQICHAQFPGNTDNFIYDRVGIQALKIFAGPVICPLVTERDVSGGLTVEVSVAKTDPAAGVTLCHFDSVNFTGAPLGRVTRTINPPAGFVSFTLNGSQTATFAHYSVTCNLPIGQTLTNITVR